MPGSCLQAIAMMSEAVACQERAIQLESSLVLPANSSVQSNEVS